MSKIEENVKLKGSEAKMKKYFYVAITFKLLAPLAAIAQTPDQEVLQKIITKLDLTSFNNSIGPRREKDEVTFKDYGATEVEFEGNKAVIKELQFDTQRAAVDGCGMQPTLENCHMTSWQFIVSVLDSKTKDIKICFEDLAMNGGSYHTQNAYLLTEGKAGFLQASPINDAACPQFAK